ncbi:MAG: CHAT domain-containing protein [Symploca sp. SIO2C1]|nr:CHAT domain-containing protein [Symploca sp. SIO2C1]
MKRRITRVHHRLLVLIFCALLGLASALTVPALSAARVTLTNEGEVILVSPTPQFWGGIAVESLPLLTQEEIEQGASNLPQQSSLISQATNPLELARQARRYYENGQLSEAEKYWQQAAEAYEQAGDWEGRTSSLINKSQSLQLRGLNPKACSTLLQAFEFNNTDCRELIQNNLTFTDIKNLPEKTTSLSPLTKVTGLRSLGEILRRVGYLDRSKAVLKLALEVVKQWENPQQESTVLLSLGNTERAIGKRKRVSEDPVDKAIDIDSEFKNGEDPNYQKPEDALVYYKEALNSYDEAANSSASPNTKINAQLNELSLLLDIKRGWEQVVQELTKTNDTLSYWQGLKRYLTNKTVPLLQDIYSQLDEFQFAELPWEVKRNLVYAQLNLAQIYFTQCNNVNDNPVSCEPVAPLFKKIHSPSRLKQIVQDAHNLKDKRAEAYAIGYLGELYEKQAQEETEKSLKLLHKAQEKTKEALKLLHKDITAKSRDNLDITYRLQWQLGRIFKAQGEIQRGIGAYEVAFQNLKNLRPDLVTINRDAQFYFRDEVEPLHREFAGLLLQNGNPSEENLRKARNVIESLQLAEIDNFFQDNCSLNKQEEGELDNFINTQAPKSAVIYTIVLKDNEKADYNIKLHIILKLPNKDLIYIPPQIIDKTEFNSTLDNLYNIIKNKIQALETIEKKAENNEELEISKKERHKLLNKELETHNKEPEELLQHLQEVYGWLIKPLEEHWGDVETLVFVLDEPLQNIPLAALHDGDYYLVQKKSVVLSRGLQLTNPEPLKRGRALKLLAAGVSEPRKDERGIEEKKLPEVVRELNEITKKQSRTEQLLNSDFTKNNFRKKLEEFRPSVIHLATHGLFNSNPEETFIVAFDENIKLRDLEELLQSSNVQMLVLSACQTALGNKRAVLGLAGVAVRAGASSTLGLLWKGEDQATASLMIKFYQELANPNVNKAEALRLAQIDILNNKDYSHPLYWAPYVLVNNWL